jgi:hypothetical protein
LSGADGVRVLGGDTLSLFLYAVANILYAQAIPTNLLVVASVCYVGIIVYRKIIGG